MRSHLRTQKIRRRRRTRINWPLLLGALLIGAVVYLALDGPELAPRDPLQENLIVQDERTGEWHIPPFEAFKVSGFPLGSDEFGRDLLSRLLYAVRPTLEMVLVVAGVRLALGTSIGLVAGYASGRLGAFFDSLISSALALPGLLVALGAIALVGVELGVLAFVIGLSITGWAETARLVREQTLAIRKEVYVEAAHALGASDTQIVFKHILRQIRAMLLMLLAFEVGSTLMLTAGLGFLGYYIGGDVWVDVDDFVARRTSGSPELGQMLATAWVRLTDPWGLVAVGSVVFSSVLGFNLIGEGLRLRIDPENEVGRLRWLNAGLSRLRLNLEQAWHPVGRLLFGSRTAARLWLLLISLALGYSAVFAWQNDWIRLPEAESGLFFEQDSPVAGEAAGTSGPGSGSSSENGGAAGGSSPDTAPGEAEPETVLEADGLGWTYSTPDALLVHPVIHTNGSSYLFTSQDEVHVLDPGGNVNHMLELPETIYRLEQSGFGGTFLTPFPPILSPGGSIVVASDTRLYAVDLNGSIIWEIPLDEAPHSPPIAGPDGAVFYLLDQAANLYAIDPDAGLLWKHEVEGGLRPAFYRPVISSGGDIFYSITNGTRGHIESLSSSGEWRWRTTLTTFHFYDPLQITPGGDWVALDDNVVRTDSGELVELAETEFNIDQFIMGRDGRTYLLSGTTVMEWTLGPGGRLNIVRQVTAPMPENVTTGLPPELNVSESGTVWFRYFSPNRRRATYVWVDFDGTVWNILTIDRADGFIIHEDLVSTGLTVCSLEREAARLACREYEKETPDPLWEIQIGGISRADDVQYQSGVLYIQTASDSLQTVRVDLPPR